MKDSQFDFLISWIILLTAIVSDLPIYFTFFLIIISITYMIFGWLFSNLESKIRKADLEIRKFEIETMLSIYEVLKEKNNGKRNRKTKG